MQSLKDFLKILDIHMMTIVLLSLTLTHLCIYFGFQSDLPSGFIGIAIVFPVVFSINAAYKRREQALGYFADLKANLMSLYYAQRDWIPETAQGTALREEFKDISLQIFTQLHLYLKDPGVKDGIPDIYRRFSDLSKLNEKMRHAGVPANEISRANQYLRSVITDFEKMGNIASYRTPIALRAYSRIFLNVFPIVFGPFFANLSVKYYPAIGYILAALYSVVLLSLEHIQQDLENPFDEIGEDDIKLNVRDQYEVIMSDE